MTATPNNFWAALVDLNKQADALVDRCIKAVEPTQPISREIPFFASIESLFANLPSGLVNTPAPTSDVLAGNNIKRPVFTNGSSRVYVREIGFDTAFLRPENGRVPNTLSNYSFNFRWNFYTSITQRRYSTNNCLVAAAGSLKAGNHLSFREPLIIEPMETLVFECELLSFQSGPFFPEDAAVVTMILSGYREGA